MTVEERSVAENEARIRRRLIEVREQERTRVARELHDDIGQRIVLLSIHVARLREHHSDSPAAAGALLDTVSDQLVALAGAVQGISHRLHSSRLDYLGLAAAAAQLCREASASHQVTIEFEQDGVPGNLSPDLALNLFRVLQEALSNAIKHSGGRLYRVTLRATANVVALEVADDGCGFDLRSAQNGDGLGLVSIQERLTLLNGEAIVESSPGRGTVVRAVAPLRRAGADSTAPVMS